MRHLRGWSLALAVVILGLTASAATGDERDGRFPGLPFVECIGFPSVPCFGPDDTSVNDYGWLNVPQLGLTGSVRAKQWAPIPLAMMASAVEFGFEFYDGPWDSNQTIDLRIRAFFTSPPGSPQNYGYSPLIPVRTVAFGAIPAEVVLQVGQARDDRGLPVPLEFIARTRAINGPADRPDLAGINYIEEPPQPLSADVEVRVVAIRLDGVDVGLNGPCSTGPVSRLDLTMRTAVGENPRGNEVRDPLLSVVHPDTHFYGEFGGSLFGDIDIASFQNCSTTTGDDISGIITSAISGDDNPVVAKTGIISCAVYDSNGLSVPNPPGVVSPYDPKSGCDLSLANGPYTAVPSPIAIPDYAPGATAP